jgi:AraC-like DNA-binding protein
MACFSLCVVPALEPLHSGLAISRGQGCHPRRRIDSHELILVRSGRLDMAEAGEFLSVDAGGTLLLRAGEEHWGTEPYPPDLSFYWVHFRTAKRGSSRGADLLRVPRLGRPARPDRLAELYHRYGDDRESGGFDPLAGALLIALMLAEVARPGARRKAGAGAALAGKADAFIRTHFHQPISTAVVARELDCNPDYLGRVFRRTYGFSLTEAIHRRQLVHARRLLLESSKNITAVARDVGFDDPGYFRRVFRRREGMSPRAFRRLYARLHVNTE